MKTLRPLSVLFLILSSGLTVFAQSTADKIHKVETNLVGIIQIEGDKPHTIQEQLIHDKVPGISSYPELQNCLGKRLWLGQ
jgi:hypothetical protein